MLVAVVRFPPVPVERDGDFRTWFTWSNDQLQDADGLTARRLLSGGDGAYLGLVEHDSAESFARMHASPVAAEVQRRLHQVLGDGPQADVYEIVEDAAGDCCGGHDRASATPGPVEATHSAGGGCCGGSDVEPVEGRSATAPPVSAGCC